jgi:hypothetical protein
MSKFNNKKLKAYGIEFDSKLELYVYQMFKHKKYDIKRCEESFELLPQFKYIDFITGKKRSLSSMKYTGDFFIELNDKMLVIEVKGVKTEPYRIRKKLFIHKYGKEYGFIEIKNQADCLNVIDKLNDMC